MKPEAVRCSTVWAVEELAAKVERLQAENERLRDLLRELEKIRQGLDGFSPDE